MCFETLYWLEEYTSLSELLIDLSLSPLPIITFTMIFIVTDVRSGAEIEIQGKEVKLKKKINGSKFEKNHINLNKKCIKMLRTLE